MRGCHEQPHACHSRCQPSPKWMKTTIHQNLNQSEEYKLPLLKHILERGRRHVRRHTKGTTKRRHVKMHRRRNVRYVKRHIWRKGTRKGDTWQGTLLGTWLESTLAKRCSVAGGIHFEVPAAHGGPMHSRDNPERTAAH